MERSYRGHRNRSGLSDHGRTGSSYGSSSPRSRFSTSYSDSYGRHEEPSRYPDSRYQDSRHQDSRYSDPRYQDQAQAQLLRSTQASKQMLYKVYGNVISILEEHENRELKGRGSMERSPIYLPDQRHKDDRDVQKIVEAQLVVFQSQINACPKEVVKEVKEELKEKTLLWNARRAEKGVPRGRSDEYIAQLFEILDTGKSAHLYVPRNRPHLEEKELREVFQGYIHGDYERSQLDKEFKDDPTKQALAPDVRRGRSIGQGVDRMLAIRPDLERNLYGYRSGDLK